MIEDSVVKGASDAGIYVGQSHTIIVRRNQVEFNVAGIEIENSQSADVYENIATNNTGGILVFDLPNLQIRGGKQTRVFDNDIFENNTKNFAPEGNIVGIVPTGTGVLVFANDDVEVFNNNIRDNQTVNLAIVSFRLAELAGRPVDDPEYDPYPERIYVHDNTFSGGGTNPPDDEIFSSLLSGLIATDPLPDILYDGITDPAKLVDGSLPADLKICIQNNTGADFNNFDGSGLLDGSAVNPSSDASPHDCAHEPLAAVVLADPDPVPPLVVSDLDTDALCATPGTTVNGAATEVSCPNLSSYRLFLNNDPVNQPNEGVVPYELTTPLFSDYAAKYRFVWLPPGTTGTYNAAEVFDFPVGTIIAKTFSFLNNLSDPAQGEDVIETRLLIRREAGWVGLPYIWNADKTEATLQVGGGSADVSWTHTDGNTRSLNYLVPNVNQCRGCHVLGNSFTPIGPKAQFLNRTLDYGDGPINQITHLNRLVIWPRLRLLKKLPKWRCGMMKAREPWKNAPAPIWMPTVPIVTMKTVRPG